MTEQPVMIERLSRRDVQYVDRPIMNEIELWESLFNDRTTSND